MTHDKISIAILSNLQHSEFKSRIKNGTEVALNLSSNTICNSNDATNLPQKLLLTDTQVSSFLKPLSNNSSTNINYQKLKFLK